MDSIRSNFWSLVGLWVLAALGVVLLCLQQDPTWLEFTLIATLMSLLLAQLARCLWLWIQFNRVEICDATYDQPNEAQVTGCRFDPLRGVMIEVTHGETTIEALLNPQYWHLLPPGALSSPGGKEAAIPRGPVSRVDKAPNYLVSLTNGSRVVGMGSRVSYHGQTYLLTAGHVWFGNADVLYVVAAGKQTPVTVADYPPVKGCSDMEVDAVLIKLPDALWAKMGVSAAKLMPLQRRTTVKCFGGSNPNDLMCSVGMAYKGEFVHQILHEATTVSGWSGSPLVSNGNIVGVHTGVQNFGTQNKGCNICLLLDLKTETDFSEGSLSHVSEQDMADRDYQFLSVDMIGEGSVFLGKGEYSFPASGSRENRWADIVQEEEDEFWDAVERRNMLYKHAETTADHLNFQRAAAQRLPPSELLAATAGRPMNACDVKESAPVPACPSSIVESQIASSVAAQVAPILEELTKLLKDFRNSLNSVGRQEGLTPKGTASSSKPRGSRQRRRRKASPKAAGNSKANTPNPTPAPVSQGKDGLNARSRRRQRRSASPKSTLTPPQASP